MEQETATLILSTFDISSSTTASVYYNKTVDNQYGTCANNRCTLTWKNINMRQILGGMYDTYETFNIYLYQISQSGSTGTATTAQFSLIDVRISGFQFLNHTYNTVSRNNTNNAYLTSYLLYTANNGTSGATTPMFNPITLTFSKSTEYINLTIDMKCTKDQIYPFITANTCLGHFTFMFKFYGIPTRPQKIITNGSRLF